MKPVREPEDRLNTLDYELPPTPGEEFTSVRWTFTPSSNLFYLQGCRVLGEEGAVISPENKLFCDFTLPPGDEWMDHSAFRRRRIPPIQPLRGWYATLVWPESGFYFHWMIEALPRMDTLRGYIDMLDGIFVPSPLQRFHRESLRALGVTEEKLIPLDKQSHYQPEHLFVPQAFAMYNPPRWLPVWYRKSFLTPNEVGCTSSSGRRLFISRADAPARRLKNEAEAFATLEPYGFELIRLADYRFTEQASLFDSADVIVGAHGAGFSNVVFCRPNTAIVEILPANWMAPCFMTLATAACCRYRHLVGQDTESVPANQSQRADFEVNLVQLKTIVEATLMLAPSYQSGAVYSPRL